MARLYRPHIPLSVRVQVAERQHRELDERQRVRYPRPSLSWTLKKQIAHLLFGLAERLMCEVSDLRLDHDPPLALRPQQRRGLGRKTYYIPDANDPEHLFYRPHGAQFEGSHDVKTRIRGDHGQYPDIVLIKRERRRQKKAAAHKSAHKSSSKKAKPKHRWPKRSFPKRKPK